uniref:Uncharacterized protein n=1 Tax=Knipowitschia caucasica TaxID=637954 RepID=A0AAV2LHD5_KNICA
MKDGGWGGRGDNELVDLRLGWLVLAGVWWVGGCGDGGGVRVLVRWGGVLGGGLVRQGKVSWGGRRVAWYDGKGGGVGGGLLVGIDIEN